MEIRPIAETDHAALLKMNNAALPAVNVLDGAEFAALVDQCEFAVVALDDDGEPLGFVLALLPGADYDSGNYQWFSEHESNFCYLDRIVVDQDKRSGGVGAALHAALAEHVQDLGVKQIALEVNLRPANPGSLRFHHRLGFAEVGQVHTDDSKLVSMMTRTLS